MAFFDQAQEMLSQGIDTARGAVSGVAMEQLGFVRGFVRLCNDGWEQGWHERNGGNLSYRLRPEDVDTARKFFDKEPRPWTPLGVEVPTMGGAYFLVTGTGNYMRNVASDPSRNIGIVELSAAGDAYRIVRGLDDGGRPTSGTTPCAPRPPTAPAASSTMRTPPTSSRFPTCCRWTRARSRACCGRP